MQFCNPQTAFRIAMKNYKQNTEKSLQYFKYAANLCHAPSLNNLAAHYLKTKDYSTAFRYLLQAATQELDSHVYANFGIYYTSIGKPEIAITYYREAINLGDIKSFVRIAVCYYNLNDLENCLINLRLGAQYGCVKAIQALANYYDREKNYLESVRFIVILLNRLINKCNNLKASKQNIKRWKKIIKNHKNLLNKFLNYSNAFGHADYYNMLVIAEQYLSEENRSVLIFYRASFLLKIANKTLLERI